MVHKSRYNSDSGLLFFIIIYLLLFYDGSYLIKRGKFYNYPGFTDAGDSKYLFFILVFLILFY